MSWFRLAGYALAGFGGWQLYKAISSAMGMAGTEDRQLGRAMDEGQSRVERSGPVRGKEVTTEEPSGLAVKHIVGRGVI